MTRLSDRYVVQRVGDDQLVLVDDSSGQEFVLPLDLAPNLARAVTYLHDPDSAEVPVLPMADGRVVPMRAEAKDDVLFAGLRQEWISGDDGHGTSFDLTVGAGLGSPYMVMRFEQDGATTYEVVDFRAVADAWATSIRGAS